MCIIVRIMSTVRQSVHSCFKVSKRIRPLVPALKKCPQKRGVVQKVFIQTPKKPNSAKRKVAKVKLSTGRVISCYIPGIGHKLTKHAVLLVRGGRAQDLIGVRYKPIFGKFDFAPPVDRISRLSKYGLSNKSFNIKRSAANTQVSKKSTNKKAKKYKKAKKAKKSDKAMKTIKDRRPKKPKMRKKHRVHIAKKERKQQYSKKGKRTDRARVNTSLLVNVARYLHGR